MFSICKDVKFLEQLQEAGFTQSYALVIVKSHLFFNDVGGSDMYDMFRKNKVLRGNIVKPTGLKDEEFTLNHEYKIEWIDLGKSVKGFILRI